MEIILSFDEICWAVINYAQEQLGEGLDANDCSFAYTTSHGVSKLKSATVSVDYESLESQKQRLAEVNNVP